nr:HAMP domain-containing sensor histidine kinase [Kofleriaceae bacterium]
MVWRDDAMYVRLQDIGAPMLVVDACDRIVDATMPARVLLAKLDIACEPGGTLPAPLVAELREALLGVAVMWRPAGETGPVLGSTRYRLGDGHFLLLVREITQQQRVMVQRLHQQRLAETGKLVAHIAHELRTPLASIVYNADVLSQRDLGGSRDLVDDIKLAADTLRRTIAGLLEYVRLGPPVGTTITLRELWDRVSSLLRPMFRGGRHELSVSLHDAELRVTGNLLTLEQIFVNLLVNAMEAAAPRPAKICVTSEPVPGERARRWRAPSVVMVSVQDDGPGIPAERREHVFEAFVTTKPNGTGLGLTIARDAASSLGGHLQLEDSELGCRVSVVLPVAPAEVAS